MKLAKQSKNILFSALILIGLSFLTFVFFKIFPSFSINEKKFFISSFIISFVLIILSWFVIKKFFSKKNVTSLVAKSTELNRQSASVSYQELFNETQAHLQQLKKHKIWTIGCLIFGWIIIFAAAGCVESQKAPAAVTGHVDTDRHISTVVYSRLRDPDMKAVSEFGAGQLPAIRIQRQAGLILISTIVSCNVLLLNPLLEERNVPENAGATRWL